MSALENGVGVELTGGLLDEHGNVTSKPHIMASIVDGAELTPEQQEFASYFVNYENSHPDEFTVSLTLHDTGV